MGGKGCRRKNIINLCKSNDANTEFNFSRDAEGERAAREKLAESILRETRPPLAAKPVVALRAQIPLTVIRGHSRIISFHSTILQNSNNLPPVHLPVFQFHTADSHYASRTAWWRFFFLFPCNDFVAEKKNMEDNFRSFASWFDVNELSWTGSIKRPFAEYNHGSRTTYFHQLWDRARQRKKIKRGKALCRCITWDRIMEKNV